MNKQGFTIVGTVFIVLILALLTGVTLTLVSTDSDTAIKNYYSLKSFYITNTGYAYYVRSLYADPDWSTPPAQPTRSFGDGSFSISTTNESANEITLVSTGVLTVGAETYKRSIKATLLRTPFNAPAYVMYFTGGEPNTTSYIKESGIIGDVFVNSDLTISNNAAINGDVFAAGNISGYTDLITGTYEAERNLPDYRPVLATDYYDSEIAFAGTQSFGNVSYSNTTLSGDIYVDGNVTLSGRVEVSGGARIIASGKVDIASGSIIGDNLSVISGDEVNIGDNSSVGKNSLVYATNKIITGNACTISPFNITPGAAFLCPGQVVLGTGTVFNGMLYAGGTAWLKDTIEVNGYMLGDYLYEVGNYVEINYKPNIRNFAQIEGLGGSKIVVMNWDEVY